MNIFNFLLWTVVRLFHKHMTVVQNHECLQNCLVLSVAYLGGGPRCDGPPFGRTMKIFLQATLYEKVRFLPCFSKNCKIQQCLMVFCVSKFQKHGQICGFHGTFRNKKCFSFKGASPQACHIHRFSVDIHGYIHGYPYIHIYP